MIQIHLAAFWLAIILALILFIQQLSEYRKLKHRLRISYKANDDLWKYIRHLERISVIDKNTLRELKTKIKTLKTKA